MELITSLHATIAAVRREFAPDPRVAIYEIDLLEDGDALVVVGVTSEPAAAEALQRRVGVLEARQPVQVEIVRLPREEETRSHAICTSSVAPMLAGPLVSDPHVSQTVFGHRLMIYRQHGRWLHCRGADGYLGWIHRGYVHRVDEGDALRWEMGDGGEVCTSLGARALAADGEVLARLPWGARIVALPGGGARLPDGTAAARVEGEVVRDSERQRRFPQRGERMVATTRLWSGAPYVWGGVTRAGVDCSGLVQVVCRAHGIAMPRDSDQQVTVGEPVDAGMDFQSLIPGDLLYFAEEGARISHVALSMGGSRIIHASLGNGGVGTNDLLGDSGFEKELRTLYVCARRVVPPGD